MTVRPEWIDFNGHLNMAYYHVIFDRGVDYFFDYLGVGSVYARSGAGSCFSMEVHVNFINDRLTYIKFFNKQLRRYVPFRTLGIMVLLIVFNVINPCISTDDKYIVLTTVWLIFIFTHELH